MPYRGGLPDPAVAALQAILATEPQLRAELQRVRRAHDDLEATIDAMVRAGAAEDELAPKQAEASRMVASEIEIAAKLAQVPGARAELERLAARRADALRASEGPLGDELRALDAELAAAAATIESLDSCLAAAERAESALGDVLDGQGTLESQPGAVSVVLSAVFTGNPNAFIEAGDERAAVEERIRLHLPYARDRVVELVQRLDELGAMPGVPADVHTRLRHLIWSDDGLLGSSELASRDVGTIISALGDARRAAVARCDRLAARAKSL